MASCLPHLHDNGLWWITWFFSPPVNSSPNYPELRIQPLHSNNNEDNNNQLRAKSIWKAVNYAYQLLPSRSLQSHFLHNLERIHKVPTQTHSLCTKSTLNSKSLLALPKSNKLPVSYLRVCSPNEHAPQMNTIMMVDDLYTSLHLLKWHGQSSPLPTQPLTAYSIAPKIRHVCSNLISYVPTKESGMLPSLVMCQPHHVSPTGHQGFLSQLLPCLVREQDGNPTWACVNRKAKWTTAYQTN